VGDFPSEMSLNTPQGRQIDLTMDRKIGKPAGNQENSCPFLANYCIKWYNTYKSWVEVKKYYVNINYNGKGMITNVKENINNEVIAKKIWGLSIK